MFIIPVIFSCNEPKEKIDAEKVVEVMSKVNTDPGQKETSPTKDKLDTFFVAYEKLYNDALQSDKVDVFATADCFANCFVESSPAGVFCGSNDKEFKTKIRQGYRYYRSIGTQSMHITDKKVTVLDAYHTMVKISWRAGVVKKNLEELTIDFKVIYFLVNTDNKFRIFAYIAEDEQKIFKELGLEPYKE